MYLNEIKPMPLDCINLILKEKLKKENRQEIMLRVISRDLTGIVKSLGNDKVEGLDKILNKLDNPEEVLTEQQVIDKIEKAFKSKITR